MATIIKAHIAKVRTNSVAVQGFTPVMASILGVAPFTLLLPYANLFWTGVLTVVIGVILASAFSAILVYAQELVPGKVGLIAGLFFGLAFGMGGIGAAVLGNLADMTSVEFVYNVCAFLPAIGLLTALLPNLETARQRMKKSPTVTRSSRNTSSKRCSKLSKTPPTPDGAQSAAG